MLHKALCHNLYYYVMYARVISVMCLRKMNCHRNNGRTSERIWDIVCLSSLPLSPFLATPMFHNRYKLVWAVTWQTSVQYMYTLPFPGTWNQTTVLIVISSPDHTHSLCLLCSYHRNSNISIPLCAVHIRLLLSVIVTWLASLPLRFWAVCSM